MEVISKKREVRAGRRDKRAAFWERYLLQENGNPNLLEKAYRDGTCLAEAEYNLEIIKAFPDSDIRKKKDLVLYHLSLKI